MIGRERKIISVYAYDQTVDWEDAKFFHRAKAMKEVNKPSSNEKMISQRQYHEINVLVDYRNNVAHTSYEELTKDECLRQINNALSILDDLCDLLEEMRGLSQEEIEPVENQKVQ